MQTVIKKSLIVQYVNQTDSLTALRLGKQGFEHSLATVEYFVCKARTRDSRNNNRHRHHVFAIFSYLHLDYIKKCGINASRDGRGRLFIIDGTVNMQ